VGPRNNPIHPNDLTCYADTDAIHYDADGDEVTQTHHYTLEQNAYANRDISEDYLTSQTNGFLIIPRGDVKMDKFLGLDQFRERHWNPNIVTICRRCALP